MYVVQATFIPQSLMLFPFQDMPTAKKSEVKEKAPVAGSLACKYCDQTVLRRDMKDHLISHKELIAAQRNNQEAAADSAASVINLKMSSK